MERKIMKWINSDHCGDLGGLTCFCLCSRVVHTIAFRWSEVFENIIFFPFHIEVVAVLKILIVKNSAVLIPRGFAVKIYLSLWSENGESGRWNNWCFPAILQSTTRTDNERIIYEILMESKWQECVRTNWAKLE